MQSRIEAENPFCQRGRVNNISNSRWGNCGVRAKVVRRRWWGWEGWRHPWAAVIDGKIGLDATGFTTTTPRGNDLHRGCGGCGGCRGRNILRSLTFLYVHTRFTRQATFIEGLFTKPVSMGCRECSTGFHVTVYTLYRPFLDITLSFNLISNIWLLLVGLGPVTMIPVAFRQRFFSSAMIRQILISPYSSMTF